MTKAELKEKIRDFEYYSNGYHELAGGESVEVKNVRIRRKDDLVLADITLHEPPDDNHFEYKNCEYPLSYFEKH